MNSIRIRNLNGSNAFSVLNYYFVVDAVDAVAVAVVVVVVAFSKIVFYLNELC